MFTGKPCGSRLGNFDLSGNICALNPMDGLKCIMTLFPWRRDSEPEPIRQFYFHLDALQTSVVHPKFMSDKLVASLSLSEEDQEYAASIAQFIDQCWGINGAPTTPERRSQILAMIQDLRQNVPSSQFGYRFCLYELDELQVIVFSADD